MKHLTKNQTNLIANGASLPISNLLLDQSAGQMLIYTKEKYDSVTEKEIMEAQTEACEEMFETVKEDLVKICIW